MNRLSVIEKSIVLEKTKIRKKKKNDTSIPLNETKRAQVKCNENPIMFGMFDYDVGRVQKHRAAKSKRESVYRIGCFSLDWKLPRFNRYSVSSITVCHKCIDKIGNPRSDRASSNARDSFTSVCKQNTISANRPYSKSQILTITRHER